MACPERVDHDRNIVEGHWARFQKWGVVATREEKTALSVIGIACLAAT